MFGGSLPSTSSPLASKHVTDGQCDGRLACVQRAHQSATDDPEHQHVVRRVEPFDRGAVEFASGVAQSDRLADRTTAWSRGRPAASRRSAPTIPSAAAARCRDSSRSRTGERRPPTASAPATRRGRVGYARSVPTPGRATPRRAGRRWPGRVPRRCR